MSKSIVAEGKTTNEAIENGLKILKVSKDKVDIKILENEDKRSFFSILAPRIVKVELKLKEDIKENKKVEERHLESRNSSEPIKYDKNSETLKEVIKKLDSFMKEFVANLPNEEIEYNIEIEEYYIKVEIKGKDLNYLIGYRGEVLNSLQTIISLVVNKAADDKVKVLVDIEEYRKKREKTLEELADKIAKTVLKTRKSVTLEPMSSYERKIIHSKLQENDKIKTYSIGEEPYRKVVIAPR